MFIKRTTTVILAYLVTAQFLGSANATSMGLDITKAGSLGTDFRAATIGWSFNLSEPVSLTSLGYWDQGADGLSDAHPVGIWTLSGALLASATVDNSSPISVTSVSGAGAWKYQSLASTLVLAAGDYVLGGFYPASSTDPFQFLTAVVNTASPVTWTGVRDSIVPVLQFPDAISGTGGYYGPNFEFAPVPETSTYCAGALLALVFAAQGLRSLRSRKQTA